MRAGLREGVIQQPANDKGDDDAADDEPAVDLVGLFGKRRVRVKAGRTPAFFQIAQTDAARDEHGGVHLFFGRGRGRRGRGGSSRRNAFDFQS